MEIIRKFDVSSFKEEYGLKAQRFLPWAGLHMPISGATCIIKGHSDTLEHINEPNEEEELFFCVSGNAYAVIDSEKYALSPGDIIMMPSGTSHYITNPNDQEFVVFVVWWNKETATDYLNTLQASSKGRQS